MNSICSFQLFCWSCWREEVKGAHFLKRDLFAAWIPTDTMSFRGRFRREPSELRRKRRTIRRVNQGEIHRLSCVSMHPFFHFFYEIAKKLQVKCSSDYMQERAGFIPWCVRGTDWVSSTCMMRYWTLEKDYWSLRLKHRYFRSLQNSGPLGKLFYSITLSIRHVLIGALCDGLSGAW